MVVEGRAKPVVQPTRKSPVASIANISSLKRYADRDYALDLLHQLAVAVGPIINHYKFKVGTLCEMYPKSPNLLGLNVNKGLKILIRLRTPFNDKAFFPMSDLIGTFLHELTHNVHGPHDAKFYALLDELRNKYETGALSSGSYRCEENRLGGAYVPPWLLSVTVRQKRIDAVSKIKYKAESRRLGGPIREKNHKNPRAAVAEAAERRFRDSKWCGGKVDEHDLGLDAQDTDTPKEKLEEYKEVIDLTEESAGIKKEQDSEVIVIDACESRSRSSSPPVTLASSVSETTFVATTSSNPLSFSVIAPFRRHLSISLSPPLALSPGKMFIGGDENYPRTKLVADIDFGRIIEWTAVTKAKERKKRRKVAKDKVRKEPKKGNNKAPKRVKKKKEVRAMSFSELLHSGQKGHKFDDST